MFRTQTWDHLQGILQLEAKEQRASYYIKTKKYILLKQ